MYFIVNSAVFTYLFMLLACPSSMNKTALSIQLKALHTFEAMQAEHLCFVPQSNIWMAAGMHTLYCIDGISLKDTQYIKGNLPIIKLCYLSQDPQYIQVVPHRYHIESQQLSLFEGFPPKLHNEIIDVSDAFFCTGYVQNGDMRYAAIQWRPSRRDSGNMSKERELYHYNTQTGDFGIINTQGKKISQLYLYNQQLVGTGEDICIWNTDNYELTTRYTPSQGNVNALAYDSTRQLLVSASVPSQVCLFDLKKNTIQQIFDTEQGIIHAIAIHPTQPIIFTGGEDKTIKCWDYEGNLLKNISFKSTVNDIAINAEGNQIAACGTLPDKTVLYALKVVQ